MSELSVDQTAIVDTILSRAGRATLPIQRVGSPTGRGTAFWFSEPATGAGGDGQAVKEYLVTAERLTHCDLAEVVLRPELCDPSANADALVVPGFDELWTPLERLGVAVMPTAGLHAHAARRGWRWTIDEVSPRLAADDTLIAALDGRPLPAYALGHGVDTAGTAGLPAGSGGPDADGFDGLAAFDAIRPGRPRALVTGHVQRCNDGRIRWDGPVPDGVAGAPVLTAEPGAGGRPEPRCLGVLLPGPDRTTVATVDRIRRAVLALPPLPAGPGRRRLRTP